MSVANDVTKTTINLTQLCEASAGADNEHILDLDLGKCTELESIGELEDFKFVYTLAIRCLELEAVACTCRESAAQVAYLLDRLTSIEWLVAE